MENKLGSKYWKCPYCNSLIPMFRPYPDMWKKRIQNHLFKCHLEKVNNQNWKEYLKPERAVILHVKRGGEKK